MLIANKISFAYPASSHLAVDGLSCSIGPGEIIALMGASGSGKTTLARLLSGSLHPASGSISADGVVSGAGVSRGSFRKKVGILLSEPDYQLIGESVEEELAFGLANEGLPTRLIEERIAAALMQSNMEDYSHHPPRFLSGGQKQKLLLLAFSLLEPAYLILDEPFQMLDVQSKNLVGDFMLRLARRSKQGIIFCTHDIEEAVWLADRIWYMQSGKLALSFSTVDINRNREQLQTAGLQMPEIDYLSALLEDKGLTIENRAANPGDLAEVVWRLWFKE